MALGRGSEILNFSHKFPSAIASSGLGTTFSVVSTYMIIQLAVRSLFWMNIGWKNARPSAAARQASLLYLYSNLAYIISFFFFFLVYFLAISYGMFRS